MSKQDFIEKASFLEVRQGGKDAILSYNCKQAELFKVVELAKENGFDLLCDIASVDMGVESQNRFLCVYHFYSTSEKEYLRLAGICENNDKPSLPSISSLFGNADWFEREAYDMMGINFEGHPDLRRILMWDSYPYNPLRKDFPLAGKEVPTPEAYEDAVGDAPMKVVPAPMEGGPFHSPAGAKTSAEKEPRSFGKI